MFHWMTPIFLVLFRTCLMVYDIGLQTHSIQLRRANRTTPSILSIWASNSISHIQDGLLLSVSEQASYIVVVHYILCKFVDSKAILLPQASINLIVLHINNYCAGCQWGCSESFYSWCQPCLNTQVDNLHAWTCTPSQKPIYQTSCPLLNSRKHWN